MYGMFDPKDVSKDEMKYLGEQIETYILELERKMIIPEEIAKEYQKQIDEGFRRVKKLIKKLKKGDKSIFNIDDDYSE